MIADYLTKLGWIVSIIEDLNIPYQISGGVAAKFYGSPRPVNDIDIDIPKKSFEILYQTVRQFVVTQPNLCQDEEWKVFMMTLEYKSQQIDICSADEQAIFNFRINEWIYYTYDLAKVSKMLIDEKLYCVIKPEFFWLTKIILNGGSTS